MTGKVPPEVRDAVAAYRLQNGSRVDPRLLPLIRDTALQGQPANAAAALRHCRAVVGLIEHHLAHDLPINQATLLDKPTVTAHLTRIARTRTAHSVKIHAFALDRIARVVAPGTEGGEPRRPAGPYSPGDVQRLLDWVDSTRDRHVRHGLLGILAFCVGAGLDTTDLRGLDGPDVCQSGLDGLVVVNLRADSGPGRQRTVSFLAPWERLGMDLAAAAGNGWVLAPADAPAGPRAWKRIVEAGRPDPRLPDLNPRRARRTWLHTHLEGGTPLQPLMAAAGICGTTSLVGPARRLESLATGERDLELRT